MSISCHHLRSHHSHLTVSWKNSLYYCYSIPMSINFLVRLFPCLYDMVLKSFLSPVNRLHVQSLSVVPIESLVFHQCPCDCSVSRHSPCSFWTGHQFQFIFRFCDPMNWHFLQVFHGPENRCFMGTVFPSPVNDCSHFTLSEPSRLFVQSISSLLSLISQSSYFSNAPLNGYPLFPCHWESVVSWNGGVRSLTPHHMW